MNKKLIWGVAVMVVIIGIVVWRLKIFEENISPNGPSLKKISIMIDWQPAAEYYGIYYSKEMGLYKDAGFDVTIINGSGAPNVAIQVANGDIVFGTTTSDNIVRQLQNGGSFYKAVPLMKFNPSTIISTDSNPINNLIDLKGKTLGVNISSAVYNQYKFALRKSGIDSSLVKEQNIGYGGVNELINKQVDAILGWTTNQAVDLEIKDTKIKELMLGDLGVKSYAVVFVVCGEKTLLKNNISLHEVDEIIKLTMIGYEKGANDIGNTIACLSKNEPLLKEDKLTKSIKKLSSLNTTSTIDLTDLDNWLGNDPSVLKYIELAKKLY